MAIKSDDKKALTKKTEEYLRKILESMTFGQEYKTNEIADFVGVKTTRAKMLIKTGEESCGQEN